MINSQINLKSILLIIIICIAYWILDSFISLITYEYNLRSLIFQGPVTIIDPIILRVPPYEIISRILVIFMIILTWFIVIKHTKNTKGNSKKLQAMFDAAPIGIGFMDNNRNIKQVNQFIKRMTGYKETELLGKSSRVLYPSQKEFERISEIKIDAVQMYGRGCVETLFQTKDETILNVCLNVSKIEDHDGLIFTVENITDQKKIDRDLKTAAQIFEVVPSGILIYDCSDDESLTLINGNPAAEKLTGIKLKGSIGKTFNQTWPNAKSLSKYLMNSCIKNETSYQDDSYHYINNDKNCMFRLKAFCIPDNKVVIVFENITQQYDAIRALKDSENIFRTVFETIPDAVAINRRSDGAYLHVNDGYLQLCGYTAEEVIGKTSVQVGLWASEQVRVDLIKRLKKDKKILNYELQFVRKDGIIKSGLMSAASIVIDNEFCSLTITKDITQRKEQELQLLEKEKQIRRASKMEAVGTLAGGVAHDFNNIMQIISGNVQLLLLNAVTEINQKLQVIYDATNRGADLSRRLLTFSRNVESKLQPVDINSEIKLAHKLLDRSIMGPILIHIELDLEENLRCALADPTQINQVITNLCINAKDAMPNGGHITITTRFVRLDETYCSTKPDIQPGEYIRIIVADNGEGMTKSLQERIFEPFFTTKDPGKGTGLGLAVVYGIIKNHNGYISVYSTPKRGTEFKIFIPAFKSDMHSIEIEDPKPLPGGTETVLIIDDEDDIKKIGLEILTRYGYTVLTADDGVKGTELYESKMNEIDLVILDIVMPEISGTEVLVKIIQMNPNAKVIIASGYSANGPIKDALSKGAKKFIDKPYTLSGLVESVREILDQ